MFDALLTVEIKSSNRMNKLVVITVLMLYFSQGKQFYS